MSTAEDGAEDKSILDFSWDSDKDPERLRKCQKCGRSPARDFELNSQIGLLILRLEQSRSGTFCRDHAVARARGNLAKSAILGWWGFTSFFKNFATLGGAYSVLKSAKRLGPPS